MTTPARDDPIIVVVIERKVSKSYFHSPTRRDAAPWSPSPTTPRDDGLCLQEISIRGTAELEVSFVSGSAHGVDSIYV